VSLRLTPAARAALAAAALVAAAALLALLLGGGRAPARAATTTTAPGARTVALRFSGGHATDPRDHGRPVVLVAAGLGVPAPVFRRAFGGVTPAPAGSEPDPAQVQRNKQALLAVLAPYGVTNDRLDEVSNRYRYVASAGELWTHAAARGTAAVRAGRVVAVRVTRGGAGYSSAPRVTVPGHPAVRIRARVAYGTDLATNGAVAGLRIVR